jgi:large subunit ribosomal protein L44e
MRKPKIINRYCPKCRKHTEHKIEIVSTGHSRGALRRGGKARMRMRGLWRGYGNHGKYSKPAIGSWKRKIKNIKKTNLIYTCQTCKKSSVQKYGKRTGKLKLE